MSFYIGLGTFWGSSWKSIYHGLALLRHSIKQEPASEWISYIIGYKNMRQKLVQPAFHFCAFRPQNKHHWRSICTPSMYYFRNSNKYFICRFVIEQYNTVRRLQWQNIQHCLTDFLSINIICRGGEERWSEAWVMHKAGFPHVELESQK